MTSLSGPCRLDLQIEMFSQVWWEQLVSTPGPLAAGVARAFKGKPAGLISGAKKDKDRPPYWECDYQLDDQCGVLLTNVCVRDTQSAGSTEPVFKRIDFTDFEVEFSDGKIVPFNIARALISTDSKLEIGEQGSRYTVEPHDDLYQRGMRLWLEYNVLEGSGTCFVTVVISVVFRGSNHDFDPGGIPVALQVFPQVTWKWSKVGATKSVKRFRSSVRLANENYMSMDMGPGSTIPMPPMANIASLFCDANTSFGNGIAGTLRTPWGQAFPPSQLTQLGGLPTSWAYLFDYVKSDLARSYEFVAVHGPNDQQYFNDTSGQRRARYRWPADQWLHIFDVSKANRQGAYDNVHLHAKMEDLYPPGHVQIHAPFCGHSCIHMHWRWASVSSNAPSGRGWAYRGWSESQAHCVDDSPQVPPNQRVTVAICPPETVRSPRDHDSILGGNVASALHPRYKMIWYCVDIFAPPAGEKQVTFEHGAGWAWRFAYPVESPGIAAILLMDPVTRAKALTSAGGYLLTLSQEEIAQAFIRGVYPNFRFHLTAGVYTFQLSPEGTHNTLDTGADGTPMEQL